MFQMPTVVGGTLFQTLFRKQHGPICTPVVAFLAESFQMLCEILGPIYQLLRLIPPSVQKGTGGTIFRARAQKVPVLSEPEVA